MTLAITLALLIVGALLAALGTTGFRIVYFQPGAGQELETARKVATAGRWMTIPGLCMYAGHYGASGIGLYALMLVVAVTMASYLAKSTTRPAARSG